MRCFTRLPAAAAAAAADASPKTRQTVSRTFTTSLSLPNSSRSSIQRAFPPPRQLYRPFFSSHASLTMSFRKPPTPKAGMIRSTRPLHTEA